MLNSNELIGFGSGGINTVDLQYVGTRQISTSSASTYFFTMSFGSENNDRIIAVSVQLNNSSGTPPTLTSASIGGVTANIEVMVTAGTSPNATSAFIWAKVPTGTSGVVSITLSGAAGSCAVAGFRISGATAPFSGNSGASSSANGISLNLASFEGAVLIATYQHSSETIPVTWTGADELYDIDNGNLERESIATLTNISDTAGTLTISAQSGVLGVTAMSVILFR